MNDSRTQSEPLQRESHEFRNKRIRENMTLGGLRHELKTINALVFGARILWITPLLKTPLADDDLHLFCTRLLQFQLTHV